MAMPLSQHSTADSSSDACPEAHSLETVDKSGARVQKMFAEIAPRYDLTNRVLSGGIDVWWRHVTVSRVPLPECGALLDVCTGTGDLAIAFAKNSTSNMQIVGADFCRPMLTEGIHKRMGASGRVKFIEADAMQLPFSNESFDAVTVAFGLRNMVDTRRGVFEMARVCRMGGRVAVLEFSLPSNRFIRSLYLLYFRNILPHCGAMLARNTSAAYAYLNRSVEEFPSGEKLALLFRSVGLEIESMRPLTFGIATLYVGIKRGATE